MPRPIKRQTVPQPHSYSATTRDAARFHDMSLAGILMNNCCHAGSEIRAARVHQDARNLGPGRHHAGGRHRRSHCHRQHHRHGLALHSCRPHQRAGVRGVDRSPARAITGGGCGRACTYGRLDSGPGRLDRSHEHVPGICGLHISERHPDRIGHAVAHLDRARDPQSSRRVGHHTADRPHVRRRRGDHRARACGPREPRLLAKPARRRE